MKMASFSMMWIVSVVTFCIFSTFVSATHEIPSFYVNKRLVYMEEELLTLSKLILRGEILEHSGRIGDHKNLTDLQGFVDEMQPLNQHALDHMTTYTSHPIGIYIIAKRLHKNWKNIVDVLLASKMCIKELTWKLDNLQRSLPNESELEEKAWNIIRLQHIFGLDVNDLAKGKVLDNMTEPLSVEDCFDIAAVAADRHEYYFAAQWYEKVIELCDSLKASGKKGSLSNDNMEYEKYKVSGLLRLAAISYKVERYDDAVAFTKQAMTLDPRNAMAQSNMVFYKSVQAVSTSSKEPLKPKIPSTQVQRLYADVCSGKLKKKPTSEIKLTCYHKYRKWFYNDKVEVLHRKPFIYKFHDVVPKKLIKGLTQGLDYMLEKSVVTEWGYTRERHTGMISNDNPKAKKLDKVFSKLTNIDDKITNSYYVAYRYAPGVMTSPLVDADSIQEHGWNSTSFVVSLEKPQVGGEMFFPFLKLRVDLTPGSAIFWYNTKPNGYVNRKLLWGECPVLLGNKLVTHKIYWEHKFDPPKVYGNLLVDLWEK